MNHRAYRLVFSKLRGMLVAVEEAATGTGKGSQGETRGEAQGHTAERFSLALRAMSAAVLLLLGLGPALVPVPSYAQIVTAPGSGAHVIQTANGLAQVNIARASGAGVSVNTYSQFDVPHQGAVLNNSPTIVNTQLAGQINGNPNFAPGQSARIIVNQVNSSAASQINGFVEVAGPRAEVVMANGSGISVNGGGFINTSRAILTTGTPNYGPDGSLTGFNVTGGNITVQGAGLNGVGTDVDQVDLIARAVQANAAIYAKSNLNVITGANQVSHDTLTATPIAGNGPAPAVSIDVSQLGGMYANRIVLASNEYGVGVSNRGVLAAQAGDLVLSSNGQLTLAGQTNASGNINAYGHDGIDNSGTTYAQQSVTANTSGALTNSGVLAAQQNTAVNAGSVASTGTLGAGINSDNSIAQSGDLTVIAGGAVSATGQNAAGGNATLQGASVNLAGSQTSANGSLALTATDGDLNLSGATTTAGGALNAHATGTLTNDNGAMSSGGAQTITAGTLLNRNGQIVSGSTLDITAAGDLLNQDGTLQAAGALSASTGSFDNTRGHVTALGADGLTLTTVGLLNNGASGTIGSNGNATVQAGQIANAGSITAVQSLIGRSVQTLFNSGKLAAKSNVTLSAGSTLTNTNAIAAGNLATLAASTFDNSSGTTQSAQLSLNATDLVNHAGTITQTGSGPMNVAVSGTFDNSAGGTFQTNSTDLTLDPATLINDNGTILHAGTGTLTIAPGNGAGAVSNVGGKIITAGQLAARAGSLDNTSGELAAKGNIAATIAGDVNNTQGAFRSLSSLALSTRGALINRNGQIQSGTGAAGDASTLDLQAASIDDTSGLVSGLGTGDTTVHGGSQTINSHGVITGNGNVAVDTSSLVNTQGAQLSGANVTVRADTADNSNSQIGNLAGVNGDVAITTTGAFTNTNGQVRATHDLDVNSATLLGGGAYSAANDVAVSVQGDFAATPDVQFNAGNNLAFTLPGTFTNGAMLESVNNLSVNAGDIVNSGAMMAGGTLTTHSNTLKNTAAIVGGSVSLNANISLSNLGPTALIGATDSNGTLELLAPDIENRDDTTATDTQAQTAIFGLGKVVLAGGKDANGNYTNANLINNRSALIQSSRDMALHANQVTNTRRLMTTTGSYSAPVDPDLLAQLGISLSGCTATDMAACGPGNPQVMGSTGDPSMIGGVPTDPPHGGQWNSTYQYTTYTGEALANLITGISPSGQIIAGGNLDASSVGLFQNYWSQVAAVGNIAMPATLDQNSWRGQLAPGVQVTYSGQYHYDNYDNSEHNWQLPFGNAGFVTGRPGGYAQAAPADIRKYKLPDYESSFGGGGTLSGTGVNIDNTAGNAGIPSLGLAPGQSVTGVNAGAVSGSAALVDPVIAHATALNVLSNLTIPQGGLFKPATAPGASYLIETNQAFTSQKTFISSDYYLQQLGLNPQVTEKRLGDGFYEQQLVRNQITSLTGKAVLGPYTDLQSMYESLLGAGASLAQSLDLPLGMSLSADQVAALTSNVIVMQTEVVDGQSVLVPVVYLAKASQQNVQGPLIAASDIDLKNAQTFNNSGTVQASNTLSIQGDQISNAFGALQSGGLMSLTTTGDVDLTSAKVNAGSLALNAGGNLLLNTATNTLNQVSATGATRTSTTLGPIASLNVTGDAAIVTGGNFEQNAGNLNVGGNLGMAIGGNWDLGTVQTGEHKVVARANGISDTNLNSATGSTVNVGGVSQIGVGGDLTATGANLSLGGGGVIAANGNVTLQSATTTSTVDSSSSGSDHHGSYAESSHTSDDVLTATTLNAGNSLAVVSGKDITLSGSAINLDKGTATLAAAGNVNVGAAMETHVSNTDETDSHSGVASHTSAVNHVDQSATYANGSTIAADSVLVASGKDINVTGSNIVGTNDIALAAQGNVNILAATDTYQDSEFHDVRHSGLSGSGGFGVSVGSSEQKEQYDANSVTQSQSRSTVGSVQGNVTISAGKDLHIGGSDIVAGKVADDVSGKTGNIDLHAQNITIDPAQDTAQSHDEQQTKSSSFTASVTGTPFDTARNLKSAGSSGSAYSRMQGIGTELTASGLDTPSVALSYGHSSSSSTVDVSSRTNTGSTIRGGGNVSMTATGGAQKDANGNPVDGDITVTGSTITAGSTASFDANRNVTFQASTDQLQQNAQSGSSSTGVSLNSPGFGDMVRWASGGPNSAGTTPSPYNAGHNNENGSATSTQQTASVVTGNSVVVKSHTGDIDVIGSGISGTQGVDLVATQGAINVLAGIETSRAHDDASGHQFGSLGDNGSGTGFSVGVGNSHTVQDAAGQTQSTIRSQIVSQNGNVTLDAHRDVTVQGSDLSAGKDLTLIGQNLNLDPGTDATQSSMSQSASQYGVTLALGGVVGNTIATVNQGAQQAQHANDPRLAALGAAQAGLAAYGAEQAATAGTSAPALVKATVSVGGGSSRSESESRETTTDGSTLTAGGKATLIATGSGTKDADGYATDGDINSHGTQISAQDVALNAARDIELGSAHDTTQESSSNSGSNASIGIGAGIGGTQNGFTLDLAASRSQGHANGESTTNHDTQINAGNTLSMTSGRDTNLRGAEVSGGTVDAKVGRDLNIESQQDAATYDSRQDSGGFQASVCVPPFCVGQTVSGSGGVSDERMKNDFQSVNHQSGIYAGNGGFNVDVAKHTQLDGGVIASTATPDHNSLSTDTLGFTNLHNKADYSGTGVGFSASGGAGTSSKDGASFSPPVQTGRNNAGPSNSQGLGPTGFGAGGTGNSESGTTYAAVSPGTINVRHDTVTGQDSTAGLSRDTANANGSVQNQFDAQKVADNMDVQKQTIQVGMQVVGDVADRMAQRAKNDAADAQERKDRAEQSGDTQAAAQAQADLDAAIKQIGLWGPDGDARRAAHAGVAAAGAAAGGGNIAGAVAGTVAGDLAGGAAHGATGDSLADAILGNIAAGAAGAAAGGALGGAGGALSGANGALGSDLYNRQLHDDEKKKLAELQKGETPDEQKRLADAACYLVQCAAQMSDNDPDKARAVDSQNDGARYITEQRELAASGLFIYGPADPVTDGEARGNDWFAQAVKSIGRGLIDTIKANNGQTSPADPNPLVDANNGTNPPATGGAVVTPPAYAMTPEGPVPVAPGIAVPGTPGYVPPTATISDGGGQSTGGGNKETGNISLEPGATPDANELRAGQGLASLGYDVTQQATASSQGISNVRTADLSVSGVGQVDVYTPENLNPSSIVKNIEKKASQGDGVLVQADLSSEDMASIAARTWGKPNAQNLQTLFFQNSNGTIVRFNRPVSGG